MHAWIDIAELTNTKNLDGGLVARSVAGLPFALREGMEISLVPPVLDAPRHVVVEFAQADGLDGGTVYFEEVTDVNVAKLLVGCHCLLKRDQLPKDASGYTAQDAPDWNGWEAQDVSAGYLGTVCAMKEMPGQVMMEVDRGQDGILQVPLVDEFVAQVDEEGRLITFALPKGLLDL